MNLKDKDNPAFPEGRSRAVSVAFCWFTKALRICTGAKVLWFIYGISRVFEER